MKRRKLMVIGLVFVLLLGGSALASGRAHPLTKAQVRGCLGMTGHVNHAAKVAPADPAVLRAFQAFRTSKRIRPAGMSTLGNLGVASYDPSHAVDLANPVAGWNLVLLPVRMAARDRSPKYCERIAGWREAQKLSAGASGRGVCVLAIADGDLQGDLCESLTMFNSYLGPLGLVEYGFDPKAVTLIPDDVSSVRYTFSDGKAITVNVRRNLATTPTFALPGFGAPIPDRFKLSVFRKWFPRAYPTKIALIASEGSRTIVRRRPATLFNELAAENRLELDRWNLTPPSERPN